jgi:hypothetical protein
LLLLLSLSLLFAKPVTEVSEKQCLACILQRKGSLPYILRRAIHQSGPDENLTFGHCFVCIRCPNDPEDYCRGWWPSDPDGGDYEGDDGSIATDENETWNKASCQEISITESKNLRVYLAEYEENNQYQVLNRNARSCLGFCSDVAMQLQWKYRLRAGNLTIPGNMKFPETPWQESNQTQEYPPMFMDRMWELYFQ